MLSLFTAYLVVTALAVAANLFAAGADFVRNPRSPSNMDRVGVPHSWMIPLGILKAAGALGLLIGIFVPPSGSPPRWGSSSSSSAHHHPPARALLRVHCGDLFLTLAVAALVLGWPCQASRLSPFRSNELTDMTKDFRATGCFARIEVHW